MTLCLNCALKALPCPLASTLNACWFMSACLRRLAGWGRVEWTRDTEYWERMVDDYQTQHGEGSKTESPSNPSLCHRVSMIQMSLCGGKYRLFWVYFSKHACKQEVYFSMSWGSEEWWAFLALICETQTSWLANCSNFFFVNVHRIIQIYIQDLVFVLFYMNYRFYVLWNRVKYIEENNN